jgi:hypothetical protein
MFPVRPIVAAFALFVSTSAGMAADVPVKARVAAAAPPSAWDIAFGSALTSDYIFRGITQSNHQPSVSAYFEPRFNVNKDNQLYVGVVGNSISFPNRAAAEIDIYGGWRWTIDKLTLDFGGWYYWYPGGQCFNASTTPVFGPDCVANGNLPNGNVVEANVSFWEVYAKATYNVTDAFVIGFGFAYSPSVLNSAARGYYYSGNAKYTFPAFANGVKPYVSGEVGYWNIGTTDAFYAVPAFPAGIPYPKYTHWNVGLGWSWKVFTVDFRYSGTTINKGDCNAFTSDHTASGTGNVTPTNPSGAGSTWCGHRGFVTLKADLTVNDNVK